MGQVRRDSKPVGNEIGSHSTDSESPARPVGRIFRPRAVERYVRRGEEHAIPRLSSPRELAWLWVLVVLLTAACLAAGAWLNVSTSAPAEPSREVHRGAS